MSPTIFGYVMLVTLLLAAAAAALEWAAQGRFATRRLWTAAIAVALVAPPALLAWTAITRRAASVQQPAESIAAPLAAVVVTAGRMGVREAGGIISRDALIRLLLPGRHALRAAGVRVRDAVARDALGVWLALSAALIAWLAIGLRRWRLERRSWTPATLDGIHVRLSPSTGPAVVGVLSHQIVVPRWAAAMQPEHRRLILAHECEHVQARDPERLALAVAALILMPWNVGLWLCAARLRRAIELDCDARVLRRYPDTREYGYVLLEVASRGRNVGPLAVPMVSLLRFPSELELRLRAMTRRGGLGARTALAGGIAALVAVAAAFAAPVPSPRVAHAAAVQLASRSPRALIRIMVGAAPRGAGNLMNVSATQRLAVRDPLPVQRRDSASAVLMRRADSMRFAARMLAMHERSLRAAESRLDSESAQLVASANALRMVQRRPAIGRPRGVHSAVPSKVGHGAQRGLSPGTTANPPQTYFEYQVDTPARMLPDSPVPPFPVGTGAEVQAMFVVDISGTVVPSSIKITRSTSEAATQAVVSVLPRMRFAPAMIGHKRVRQLVQQPFTFALRAEKR
ncbi:MAG: M56 family metallopeptidase [Gemmatimonadaceae bacterium]